MPAPTPDPPAYPRFGLADAFILTTCIAFTLVLATWLSDTIEDSANLGSRIFWAYALLPFGISLGFVICTLRFGRRELVGSEVFGLAMAIFLFFFVVVEGTYVGMGDKIPGDNVGNFVFGLLPIFYATGLLVLLLAWEHPRRDRDGRTPWTHRLGCALGVFISFNLAIFGLLLLHSILTAFTP